MLKTINRSDNELEKHEETTKKSIIHIHVRSQIAYQYMQNLKTDILIPVSCLNRKILMAVTK